MDNNEINSCLMWAVDLETPVDFGSIFDLADLKDTGIELDSHITLLYAQGKTIERDSLLDDIKNILNPNDYQNFYELCKEVNQEEVLDFFDLDKFENDSDYIILKLKKDKEIFKYLRLINKGLRLKYNVSSDFDNYVPHITIAELQPGTAKKYIKSGDLHKVLECSLFDFEDLFISYGTSNEPEDRKKYFLTQFKNIDRFFRLEHLKKSNEEILKS